MMEHTGGMIFWMIVQGLIGLAFLVLLIVAIVWLVRQLVGGAGSPPDPALEELRRRYAAGDIDEEEFARRKSDLLRE